YLVWNTDNSGNFISMTNVMSGSSTALESLENSFHQDLNGDGQIGVVTTVIESNGATSLTQLGDHYYLYDSTGAGPSLKMIGGGDYLAGMAGTWSPIGAEQTATGYEVAWKLAGTDSYLVWNTDNSGNYLSMTNVMSGSSAALQSLETSFHQDLNDDGQIGVVLNGSSGGQTLTATGGATTLIAGPSKILNADAGADT